jgi:hypothetical protein
VTRHRTIDQSLNGRLRARVRVGGAEKSMRRMMAEVDAAKLPNELFDIEIASKMPQIDGAPHYIDQNASECCLYLEDLVPHHSFDIVELEQSRCHRTSAGKARAVSPSEPVADQLAQPRESFFSAHRRLQHALGHELDRVIQQLDLDCFFGAKVREQSALRHPGLLRESA